MAGQQFQRHKTAIVRTTFSRPVRIALQCNLINDTTSVLDYGCGRGNDVEGLRSNGIRASGWDPVHLPSELPRESDIVNLGYVVNVIETATERADVVRTAWGLARRALIISARLQHEAKGAGRFTAFEDGFVTGADTFQKFYGQQELREWIDGTLNSQCLAAAPGVFLVFRDEELRCAYCARQHKRIVRTPTPRMADVLFERHRAVLEPLMAFFADRGRLPEQIEVSNADEVETHFRSIPQAFAVIRRVTGSDQWEAIREVRKEELRLRLALWRLAGRPRWSGVLPDLQRDIRSLFSTYSHACEEADKLLFQAGKLEVLDAAMRTSSIGKLTGNALYLHSSALEELPTILRVYEGCARHYLGHVEGANIIKLHRTEPKVSYLLYPDFDGDPHPTLVESIRLKLSNGDVKHSRFSESDNPPILHRKEEFLCKNDPRRRKFEQLTKAEERAGLFDNVEVIGTRNGWQAVLSQKRVQLRGHRLVRAKS